MMPSMTEEEILEFGKTMAQGILNHASYEERLRSIPASERFEGLSEEELRDYILANERLRNMLGFVKNQAG